MSCPICERNKRKGEYDFNCLGCCVDLVLSARPDRKKAEAMIHAVRKYHTRKEIIEEIKCRL